MNKYEILSTDSLIRAIQRVARLLESKEATKMAADRRSATQKELSQMRAAVIPRLKAEDRTKAKFFRVDSHVLYSRISITADDDWSTQPTIPRKNGIVTGHVDGKVLVQFEGEPYSTLCWPHDLIIKYIR